MAATKRKRTRGKEVGEEAVAETEEEGEAEAEEEEEEAEEKAEEEAEEKTSSPKDQKPNDDLGISKIEVDNEEAMDEEPLEEEERKRIVNYEFDGRKYSYKEKPSVIEEKEGKIEFRVVNNDGKGDELIILTGLKNIFQKQLPEMPKAYITRLVFDRSHVSIAVVRKPLIVVGGITIKPFESHHFAEIVFCAISSSEQVRGYGAHMMNHLKTYVRGTMDVKYFLTYADNYAIGYFKKQGFTKEITLPKKLWMGYIKDYEGGTLMQCTMLPRIRYLDGPKILSLQRAAILKKIRSIGHSHLVRPGLKHFKENTPSPLDPLTIPGIREAGWTKEMDDLAQQPKRSPHYAVMMTLLTEMMNHPSNWPFLQPVNKDEVADYYQVITEPMDLSTMEVKLDSNAYEALDDFLYDCKLIFANCRQYNGENTTFFKNANKLEKVLINKLKDFPEYSQYVDMLQQ
ncbi:histone acetyltransferase [Brettanomyces nanus]|uniref:Histone acetyltransferase GCN5 n=1 Tax=Eeniella nana TaxID=13502 RepID=A0A875S651_EENNA|nr:histone acetyltransferase [Brettanomyces nanus]QPG77081.1 histone acetyltransferase [Brettanomyces nanus]